MSRSFHRIASCSRSARRASTVASRTDEAVITAQDTAECLSGGEAAASGGHG